MNMQYNHASSIWGYLINNINIQITFVKSFINYQNFLISKKLYVLILYPSYYIHSQVSYRRIKLKCIVCIAKIKICHVLDKSAVHCSYIQNTTFTCRKSTHEIIHITHIDFQISISNLIENIIDPFIFSNSRLSFVHITYFAPHRTVFNLHSDRMWEKNATRTPTG